MFEDIQNRFGRILKNIRGQGKITDKNVSGKDVAAAKAAGISSIACTYGYITDETEPKNWNADFYVDHALEILNVI